MNKVILNVASVIMVLSSFVAGMVPVQTNAAPKFTYKIVTANVSPYGKAFEINATFKSMPVEYITKFVFDKDCPIDTRSIGGIIHNNLDGTVDSSLKADVLAGTKTGSYRCYIKVVNETTGKEVLRDSVSFRITNVPTLNVSTNKISVKRNAKLSMYKSGGFYEIKVDNKSILKANASGGDEGISFRSEGKCLEKYNTRGTFTCTIVVKDNDKIESPVDEARANITVVVY